MKEVKRFICYICKEYAKSQLKLNKHTRECHKGFAIYMCECGKAFNVKSTFDGHMNSKHTKRIVYVCERGCDKTYMTINGRGAHYRSAHPDFVFTCSWVGCDQTFKLAAICKKHEEMHLDP